MAALLHQPGKGGKVSCHKSISLGKGTGILLKIVDGTQHGAVAALFPQAGQLLPEVFFLHLAQHPAVQTGRHGLHLVPDGRELAGQLTVAGAGIGDAEGHALGQDAVRMYLLNFRRLGSAKSAKSTPPTALVSWSSRPLGLPK